MMGVVWSALSRRIEISYTPLLYVSFVIPKPFFKLLLFIFIYKLKKYDE